MIINPANVSISEKARDFLSKKIPDMFSGRPSENEPGKKIATLTHILSTTTYDEKGNEVVLYGPRWMLGANYMHNLGRCAFVEVSKDKFLAIWISPDFQKTAKYLLELVDNDEVVVVESGA